MASHKYKSNNSTPAVQSWLAKSSVQGALVDKNSNAEQDIKTFMENSNLYYKAEPGITHPLTTSTVKLRDNGMIDIFVSTNQGIRIDPETKTVNFISTTEKHHTTDMNTWAEGNIIFNCHRKFDVNSDTDINLNAKKDIKMTSNKWKVNVLGDIDINAKGNTSIKTNGVLSLKGSSIKFSGNTYDFE